MAEQKRAVQLKYCDIVMKGGITSGVVYPPAVVELSREYQFKNIGGASAGAIAAAATAAAEYGRQRNAGPAAGFERLAGLPDELATPDFLVRLFSPASSTAKGYRVAISVMKARSVWGVIAGLSSLFTNFAGGTLLGLFTSLLLIGALIWIGDLTQLTRQQTLTLGIVAAISAAIVTFTTVVAVAVVQTARGLVANGYGFCNGFSKQPDSPHLTNWMYDLFNKLAGLQPDVPLTFRHLWTADGSDVSDGSAKAINLEVVTTNLTHLGPYTIPFRNRIFYFNPKEWEELFPGPVVSWLLSHPAPVEREVASPDGMLLVPLPDPADLPVVVAARLSLSFPGLVSAVPLYAVDFSLKANSTRDSNLLGERCWFSDGGISSNFPVHFFDSPIPQWPTFAINLKQPHSEHDTPGSSFVHLPSSCGEGHLVTWRRFNPTKHAFADLGSFIAAIINTMKDWRDNLQTRMPGYRNRIVHISLKPDEGGLNLTMPPELVTALTTRGRIAGEALRTKFDFEQHVWTRYRATMSMLSRYLEQFADDYANPGLDAREVWEIIKGVSSSNPVCYDWNTEAQRRFAVSATKISADVGSRWTEDHHFENGAPRPEADLTARPRF